MLADADALAVRDEHIEAVGRSADLLARRGPHTRVIDAHGATLTPGLCDGHIHLLHWARARGELDLSGVGDPAAAVARVAQWVAERPGEDLVVGRGWSMGEPFRGADGAALDAVAGGRTVLLYSRDFHNLWVSRSALRAAGVTRDTLDPAGGTVARDARGEPTGLLIEHAMKLMAPLERGVRDDGTLMRDAVAALHAQGVTAVHDFEGADAHRVLRATAADRRLRTLMHLPHAQLDDAISLGFASGLGDDWFRTGAVKLFADGTLGSRTAALLAPYDGSDERGRDLMSPAELAGTARRALEHGWSVAVHAIGDRAVRAALDAFEAARGCAPPGTPPPRIEHVQLLDPSDAPRFTALGVVASMQPSHCVTDRPLADRWWGSRTANAYPWRTLLDLGARLVFGSDAPVEPPSAVLGLHAAVGRRDVGDAAAWVPQQAIGIDAALTAYTEGAARLAGWWPRVGNLDPGAAADLVLWDRDLHSAVVDLVALAASKPRLVVLGGTIVHEEAAPNPERRGRTATEVAR